MGRTSTRPRSRRRYRNTPPYESVAVIGLPDDDLGNTVHAIVEADPEVPSRRRISCPSLPSESLRYKLPRSIEYTDQPLRNEAGKLRRSALRAERVSSERARRLTVAQDGAKAATKPTSAEEERSGGHEAEDVGAVGHISVSGSRPRSVRTASRTAQTTTAAAIRPSATS